MKEMNILGNFERLPGVPLNRYAKKRRHKWEMKKRHTKGLYTTYKSPIQDEMEMRSDDTWHRRDKRNGGYTYWKTWYISGTRAYARQSTNRRIRQKYRELIGRGEFEDICVLSGGEYEKEFDYWWTVY